MGCFVVAEFLLTSASRGPSAIAEPLVLPVLAAVVMRHGKQSVVRLAALVPVQIFLSEPLVSKHDMMHEVTVASAGLYAVD